jgi:hypothetical protein
VGKGEVALGRWPATIGGWKTIEKSDGSMVLKSHLGGWAGLPATARYPRATQAVRVHSAKYLR